MWGGAGGKINERVTHTPIFVCPGKDLFAFPTDFLPLGIPSRIRGTEMPREEGSLGKKKKLRRRGPGRTPARARAFLPFPGKRTVRPSGLTTLSDWAPFSLAATGQCQRSPSSPSPPPGHTHTHAPRSHARPGPSPPPLPSAGKRPFPFCPRGSPSAEQNRTTPE